MLSGMIFQDIIIRYALDHWLSLRGNQEVLYVKAISRRYAGARNETLRFSLVQIHALHPFCSKSR